MKRCCWIILYFLFPSVCLANPTITSISGTIATGQTITITGTDMEQEQSSSWTSFFTTNPNASGFEGSNPTADGYTNQGDASYVTSPVLAGKQAYQLQYIGTGTGYDEVDGGLQFYPAGMGNNITDMYYRGYVRFSSSNESIWPTIDFKNWWWGEPGSTNVIFVQPDCPGPADWLAAFTAESNPFTFNFPTAFPFTWDTWYCMEIHFNNTTQLMELWVDNQQVVSRTAAYTVTTPDFMQLGINLKGEATGVIIDTFFDNVAVKSGGRVYPSCIVQVSNNATYGSGTVNYCPPVFISDTSVQATLNLTGLGSGPYYLWITDNRQQVSRAYQLGSGSGSGGGDGSGGGCFISTSVSDSPVSQGATFLVLAGIVLMGIVSLLRKYTSN